MKKIIFNKLVKSQYNGLPKNEKSLLLICLPYRAECDLKKFIRISLTGFIFVSVTWLPPHQIWDKNTFQR